MRFNRFYIDDWESFNRAFIRKNKLIYTGSGSYCTVYKSVNQNVDYVYKVISRISQSSLDGYLVYLKHVVLKNIGNPYVPKIYGANIYEYEDVDWWTGTTFTAHAFIIKMEKLHPYSSIHPDTRDKVMHDNYDIDMRDIEKFDSEWSTERALDCWFEQLERFLRTPKASQIKRRIRSPKLLKVLLDIKEQTKRKGVDYDFHNGNIMWRKLPNDEHQLVIIDPLY